MTIIFVSAINNNFHKYDRCFKGCAEITDKHLNIAIIFCPTLTINS